MFYHPEIDKTLPFVKIALRKCPISFMICSLNMFSMAMLDYQRVNHFLHVYLVQSDDRIF